MRNVMRRRWALLGAALLLTAAACGGDDDDAEPAATDAPAASAPAGSTPGSTAATTGDTAAPERGGILRFALGTEPTTFDPHKGASGYDHVSLYPIYDRLLGSDPTTLEPIPGLASAFEFTDPMTLHLTLQEGVTFHDGTPFDAAAVVYNIDRATTMEDSSIKTDLASVESAEAVGDHEVIVHLNQPDSSLLGVFADRAGMMVSPTAAEQPDFGDHPVGTGPHRLASWNHGVTWTYERNEDYWQPGLPYLDGIEISMQADLTTRINALRSGQLDFIDGIEPGRLAELEEAEGIEVSSDPTLLEHILWWNMGRPPLDDVRVRRAINMAIDRESLWEGTQLGTGEVAWMPVPSQHWAYDADLVPSFEYDPEAAKALLEEAGYGDGFTLTFSQGTSQEFAQRAEVLQAQLAEIGVTVEIRAEDGTAPVDTYFRNKQTDILNSSMTSRADPSLTFQTMFAADSFYNTGQYAPEGFDALLDAARAAQTTAERAAAFAALNAAAIENALWVPLLYPASITAWRSEFAGFVPSLIGKPDFLTVHLVG